MVGEVEKGRRTELSRCWSSVVWRRGGLGCGLEPVTPGSRSFHSRASGSNGTTRDRVPTDPFCRCPPCASCQSTHRFPIRIMIVIQSTTFLSPCPQIYLAAAPSTSQTTTHHHWNHQCLSFVSSALDAVTLHHCPTYHMSGSHPANCHPHHPS